MPARPQSCLRTGRFRTWSPLNHLNSANSAAGPWQVFVFISCSLSNKLSAVSHRPSRLFLLLRLCFFTLSFLIVLPHPRQGSVAILPGKTQTQLKHATQNPLIYFFCCFNLAIFDVRHRATRLRDAAALEYPGRYS